MHLPLSHPRLLGLAILAGMSLGGHVFAALTQSAAAKPFDADWRFTLGDPAGAERTDFDDSSWRQLDVPHDWSIEGAYDEHAPTAGSGGYLPAGVGWYRKRFQLPPEARQQAVSIRFGGVYQNSTVWLNGVELGVRPYGYSAFHYDLTAYLRWDGQPNVIAVRVDNSQQPNSRWYSGSGIYRRVWLTVTSPLRIPEWGTFVTTPEVNAEEARVRLQVRVHNGHANEQEVRLEQEILDDEGHVVARTARSQRIPPHTTVSIDDTILVAAPKRWSPDTPHLYRLRSVPSAGNIKGDPYVTTFGIRSIAYTPDDGFLLNGGRVKMKGMCLHHDGGAVGAAVPEAVLERRLRLLKEMGCNAVRASHNPMSDEFYDLCDRLGLLVMDEAFDEWTIRKPQIKYGYSDHFHAWFERDLVDMIHRNRNHPSIVIWSAGNEIGEQRVPEGPAVLKGLVEIFHREDPSRPVTAAMDHIFNQNGRAPDAFTSLLDVVGYNYVDRWGRRRETQYEDDRHAYPDRKFIGTENRSARGVRGHYRFGPLIGGGFGSGRVEPAVGPIGALYLNDSINAAELWRYVATRDYVAGDFAWTGFDYLGEARWPRKLAASGPLDTCGFKKDAFYFYQSIWTEEPMVHLFPHWNWAGREAQTIPVVVYSNCDVVELFLNGRSLGAKAREFPRQGAAGRWNTYARPIVRSSTVDMQLVWDVPYEPGELRAVGYRPEQPDVEKIVRTAGAAARLEVTADRAELRADGRDVLHVTVRALDQQGNFAPLADQDVTFQVSGPARLIGVDNGDPESHESYRASHRRLFAGMALGLVQARHEAGTIRIDVQADGLARGTIEIPVLRTDLPEVRW
jgi:beta-galactosidase